jgi:folylpolyglutamate synthase
MPAYFRFLTLLGFRIFSQERVECAVLEVGLGGRLDATNVIRKPVVCGITSLGMDHVEILGDTIAKIAREKAGIFKSGVPAFTSPQPADAMEALCLRAAEVGAPLLQAAPIASWEGNGGAVALGLAGAHQELNAAVAVHLLREWAKSAPTPPAWGAAAEEELALGRLPATWRAGLAKTEWWGRAQIVVDETAVDGADTAAAPGGGGSNSGISLDGDRKLSDQQSTLNPKP